MRNASGGPVASRIVCQPKSSVINKSDCTSPIAAPEAIPIERVKFRGDVPLRTSSRPWLLASVSVLALASALALANSEPARADNECGTPTGGVVTCAGSSYANVKYTSATPLTLNFDNSNTVITSGVLLTGGTTGDLILNATRFQSASGFTVFSAINTSSGGAILTMDSGSASGAANASGSTLWASSNSGLGHVILNGGDVAATLAGGYALRAQAGLAGTAIVEMNGGSVTSAGAGLVADTPFGASATTQAILNGGSVTSTGDGVSSRAYQGSATTSMTAGSITSGGNGLVATRAAGASAIDVLVSMQGGTVLSNGTGILARNAGAGTARVQMTGGTVSATGNNADGIFAQSTNAAGRFDVSVTGGTVTGGTGTGAAIHAAANNGGTINIGANAVVDGTASGVAINQTGGSTIITSAGLLKGAVLLGAGNNVMNVTGGSIAGNVTGGGASALNFNLGTGSFTYGAAYAISGVNSVAMNSGTAEIDGSLATTTLAVNGGRLILDGAATAPGGAIVSGGTLVVGDDTHASATLTGALNVLAGGQLHGVGTIMGDVGNAGIIAPGNSIGTLTINGNYTGNGGTLAIESVLGGDSSPTDKLVVTGNTSGSTFVRVTNLGGTGAQTVEGIKVVDVGGPSNGTFTLQGDYVIQGQQAVVGGAYAYTLQKNGVSTPTDGDWYLRSSLLNPSSPASPAAPAGPLYQPGVPLYESYGQILLGMNGLSTLRQRVGDRYSGAGDVAAPSRVQAPSPVWARVEGQHTKMTPSTTTGSTYTADQMKLQSGFDGLAYANTFGQLIFGLSAHYTTLTSDIKSFYGNGKINVEGAGLGGSLTWFGENGFYVDGQSQVTWYKSDLSSDLAGTVAGNKLGYGYAVGAEGGRRIPLGGNFSLTPQAQLTYSTVNFDSFNDRFGALVSNDRARSLLGRAGLLLDHQRVAQGNDGQAVRSDIYGIANLYYEFLNGTVVDVAGTKFASNTDRLWGGVGVGGNYRWANDKYAVYGEVSFNTSLADAGDNYAYKGTVGFRAKW